MIFIRCAATYRAVVLASEKRPSVVRHSKFYRDGACPLDSSRRWPGVSPRPATAQLDCAFLGMGASSTVSRVEQIKVGAPGQTRRRVGPEPHLEETSFGWPREMRISFPVNGSTSFDVVVHPMAVVAASSVFTVSRGRRCHGALPVTRSGPGGPETPDRSHPRPCRGPGRECPARRRRAPR